MKPGCLLLRADASPAMGTGHVMRCLALAQTWQAAGGRAVLLAATLPPGLGERAEALGAQVRLLDTPAGSAEDALRTIEQAASLAAVWTVVDGYHFDAAYQQALKKAGLRLLWIDDFGTKERWEPEWILNQNLGASPAWYWRCPPTTETLLGTRYVLLRREFLSWRAWRREIPPCARRLLVTLGGSDPAGAALKVVEALRWLGRDAPTATVVAGGSNPHFQKLAQALAGSPHRLLRHSSEMPQLMAEADLAIAAGGTTAWELAFMGLPALMLCLADNQRQNCRELERHGAAMDCGPPAPLPVARLAGLIRQLALDAGRRTAMSAAGRRLVDGGGAQRVSLHLREHELHFRPAVWEDAHKLFEWFNDPVVRAVSFSQAKVGWEEHCAWLKARLADPQHELWVAENATGQALGQVRFAVAADMATISVSLDPAARGQGIGPLVIWAACRRLQRLRPAVARVQAWIKPENAASVRAFEKAGFTPAGQKEVRGTPALVYEWLRQPS